MVLIAQFPIESDHGVWFAVFAFPALHARREGMKSSGGLAVGRLDLGDGAKYLGRLCQAVLGNE
jgi:hypothetical protein